MPESTDFLGRVITGVRQAADQLPEWATRTQGPLREAAFELARCLGRLEEQRWIHEHIEPRTAV